MLGAIIGDIVGSRFERINYKAKDFEFFDKKCRPTDDSIMSLAVAASILQSDRYFSNLSANAIHNMQELGRKYKNAGYGGTFIKWIMAKDPQPYNSFGNGAAMRVSPCGYAAENLDEAKMLSEMVTKVSHNHPEGLKGAEAIATAIFLSNSGTSKERIREYINENYYSMDLSLDEIRTSYKFDVTCQGSVPQALIAFFESTDFESAIRNAVSIGGDSDTIAAMAGSVAEAFYGIPRDMIESAIDYLDSTQMEILYYFEKRYLSKALDEDGKATLSIFDVLDECVDKVIPAGMTIEVDGELQEGVIHAQANKEVMKPDFSSFDKYDKGKEAREKLAKAGADISKTAQKAGEGLSKTAKKAGVGIVSAAKEVKNNVDKARKNTEPVSKSISNTKKAGKVEVSVVSSVETPASADIEQMIFDLNNQIDLMSSHADAIDYLVSIASGIACGMMDIIWVGEFSLEEGRAHASEEVDSFVKKVAKVMGCPDDDLASCVEFLEKFHIPADGNTPDFGGGLQHHLRDFAHHPTIAGLIFSLLTQFTRMSYGTDVAGRFIVVPVPEKSLEFIGNSVSEKILNGTIVWFFHLVSDVAGSHASAGLSGGTGIPGPILSLAKEISAIPAFKNMKVGDNSVSVFLSKLFNGTIFAQKGPDGKILKDTVVKFDLRGELGALEQLGKQAVPVIANECIVRAFYFIRRFASELKKKQISSLSEISEIDWDAVKPYNNPTLTRMLTIATGVFTAIDITEAIATEKYWVSVNYVGVGRFAVAIGAETVNYLKVRNVAKIKEMYESIDLNTYTSTDDKIYKRLEDGMEIDKLGLTVEQTEILYNIEAYKTLIDIGVTVAPINRQNLMNLKKDWIDEWKHYMESGFSGFLQDDNAVLHWYSLDELNQKIMENDPSKTWFRLVLLESMLFEPYYPLSIEKDKKGNDIPSKRYDAINGPIGGYRKGEGDNVIDLMFGSKFGYPGYIKRLRKCYDKVTMELNEVLKTAVKTITITAGIALAVVITAGSLAPTIAVALVGSQFAGLSGAALTSACLAYLGGGAIAAGGLGMAGGTAAIVGGGAILGLGGGAVVGGAVGAAGLMGRKATILQSAKLLVAVREIFLNDEKDIEYSDTVYEQYVNKIMEIEKGLVELRLKADVASGEEKKKLKLEIKNAEETVEAMKIARKDLLKFKSSFEAGLES